MNNRPSSALLVAIGFGLGLAWCSNSRPQSAHSQDAKNDGAKKSSTQAELESSSKQFVEAFNRGDAAAVAAQFLDNAEVIDEDGTVVAGRENIQARFADLFKTYPKAKVTVELSSLRQLGPDVAVEDGTSVTTLDPDQLSSRSPYTLVQLRKEGKWFIARIRDFPEETDDTAHDQLQTVAWLIGEWVDQSGDTKVETSCRWADGGSFLIQDYVVKTEGRHELKGTQWIGWDSERKTVRSWAFDQEGGFVESTWTPVDDGWLIRANGYTSDGQHASATRRATQIGQDLYEVKSMQRLVGEDLLPDTKVRVARRPPEAAGL